MDSANPCLWQTLLLPQHNFLQLLSVRYRRDVCSPPRAYQDDSENAKPHFSTVSNMEDVIQDNCYMTVSHEYIFNFVTFEEHAKDA